MNNRTFDVDLFVIGAGSGGVRASRMAAAEGASVAVAEGRFLGGTCVNVGCVPKKLFVYGAHYHEDFEDAKGYGWTVEGVSFDWQVLRDNKTREIERLNGVYENLLNHAGVELIIGYAVLIDQHTVEVGDKRYTAERILVASGSKAFVPDFPGSEHAITSDEAFYLEKFPKKVIVVGGGYIAVEFAGIFAGLGADTVLSYRGDLFLRGFDDDVRTSLRDEMLKKQIDLKFNSTISKIEKLQDEQLQVTWQDGTTETVDAVMYATGRLPNTEGLGLKQVGVELAENGAIKVDDNFQTSVSTIYALGDVIDRFQLTPVALAEAMALVGHLYKGQPVVMDYSNIATAVFSQPNIGTVGLTEEQARKQCSHVVIYKSDFRHMKHTLSGRDERVFMKLVVDGDSDRVMGCHMVGSDAGEITQGLAIALKAGATKAIFDQTIGIHPTAAEEFVTMRTPA
ncbi:MAG: glutathione-disulfide reductase [Endozoicomonadaceae bacterium]|nr:glutathione-disulfide reductase [Endozoicomonadaceae bacterium]